MKRLIIASLGLLFISFTACKSSGKKSGASLQATADSLYQEVLDIHEEGMIDWMKIERKQEMIKGMLDSIAALPATAEAAAAPLKTKLDDAMNALATAYDDMDKWMPTLNLDSARNDLQKRIDYFTGERLKAKNINEAIFNSIKKADAVLKENF